MHCEKGNTKWGSGMCLCPFSFGMAWGIVFAVFVAGLAWIAYCCGTGTAMVEQMSNFYHGYEATWVGGWWGALWGFIEGFLMGFFIALIYDWMMCCKAKKCCSPAAEGACKCCGKPSNSCSCQCCK